ncbi:MAG: glucose-6-phosphate isomerase [Archaeoglobales archaeon]|jgi:glucose-6-phosphate isomerase|nr:glucose-6-phosphate isomerase [Archaeoglobales archaeon]TDA28749.1 MAG: glucose-6-phosphate isomerase [Archaeoglobi archaeon]
MEYQFGDFLFRPEIRRASDLLPVLAYPEKLQKDFDAYYMFRDIFENHNDREKILKHGLRYDFTIIPPASVGREKIKTYGHYHPENSSGLTYPEIYQVIDGKAFFILQKKEFGKISDCIVIEAGKGDIVIVPPNYGHVTINPTEKVLITSNWVSRNFCSIYEPYTNLRGACYYYIEGEWIKNPRYLENPKIKFLEPHGSMEEEMYYLIEEIEILEFLTKPEKYPETLKRFKKF